MKPPSRASNGGLGDQRRFEPLGQSSARSAIAWPLAASGEALPARRCRIWPAAASPVADRQQVARAAAAERERATARAPGRDSPCSAWRRPARSPGPSTSAWTASSRRRIGAARPAAPPGAPPAAGRRLRSRCGRSRRAGCPAARRRAPPSSSRLRRVAASISRWRAGHDRGCGGASRGAGPSGSARRSRPARRWRRARPARRRRSRRAPRPRKLASSRRSPASESNSRSGSGVSRSPSSRQAGRSASASSRPSGSSSSPGAMRASSAASVPPATGAGQKLAGRDVEPGQRQGLLAAAERGQEIVPARLEQASSVMVPGVTTRTTSRWTSVLRAALARLRRILHLLADRDLEAVADQPLQIALGVVHRHPAHRDVLALMPAAPGQRDVERRRRCRASSKNSS